jgi:hypothetical protein
MKTIKFLFALLLINIVLTSCSSDDDNPDPVNEEEVITTVRFTLTSDAGDTVVFQSQDLDGDGPDAPVNTVTGTIIASTLYTGSVQFLNELESPAEDITLEVLEEDDEHQVFYAISGTSGSAVTYSDMDADGNPIGVSVDFSPGVSATNNTLTLTLIHEPNKSAAGVSDGDITNAGGETDVEVTFNFNVEN